MTRCCCLAPGREIRCPAHKWGRVLETPAPWRSAKCGTRPTARARLSMPRSQKAAPGGASTPTEGLTTRRSILLMATQNPTGVSPAITLSVPACDRPFLSRVLGAARDGLAEEVERFSGQLREPARLLGELAAFEKLAVALDGAPLRPDFAVCGALTGLLAAVDSQNDYERAASEHWALACLVHQLCGGGGGGGGGSMSPTAQDFEFAKALGANLIRIRTLAELSQGEVGFRAGLHPTAVGLIERGERTPSARSLFQILSALEADLNEAFAGIKWRSPAPRHGSFEFSEGQD
jgi:DNA-binding XRE family transcriptional regulator